MDFGEMFRILRRHWRISVPVLLLTIVATVGMIFAWPTKYQSNAEITLVGPQSLATAQGNGNNPYLVVGDLIPMASILTTNLSTQQAIQQLQAMGVTDTFTAVVPDFAAGPFITLTLEGKDPAEIRQSMPATIGFAEQQLKTMQENGSIQTPSSGIVGAAVIAPPSRPTPVLKTKIEVVAAVALFGMVVLFLFTFGAEALGGQRRKKATPTRRHRNDTPSSASPSSARRIGLGQPQQEGQDLPPQDRRPVRVQ
jgi:uncharacterized protein involved in exopolysaccharide biosynthesis